MLLRDSGLREFCDVKLLLSPGFGQRWADHNLDMTVRKSPEASLNERLSLLQASYLFDTPHLKFLGVTSLQTKGSSATCPLYIDD
jgi:hypothetical protein